MSTITGTSAATVAAATAAANSSVQEAAQSIISGSTGNSSMDVNSLVTALVNAKTAGQSAALTAQQTTDTTQLSAIGQLTAALSALQAGLGSLANGSLVSTFTATADGTGLTASAGSGATAGEYSIDVSSIATSQAISSGAFSSTAALGTGAMQITVNGQSTTININSSNNTLGGIASAINSASNNPGVTATVVNGTDGAHLVLRTTATGAQSTVSVSLSNVQNDNGLSSLGVTSTPGSDISSITSTGSTWTQTAAGQEGSAQSITSGSFASGDELGQGTMTVSVGSKSMTLTLTPPNDTLNDVASAINGASNNPGVTASVQTNSSTGAQQLVLTSNTAGAGNTINVSVNPAGSGEDLSQLAVSSTTDVSTISSTGAKAWTQSSAAQDAQFTIDGTPATSSGNSSTTAIQGVTLNLTSAAVGTTQNLTVAADTTSQATAITNFVSLYNSLVTTVGSLTVGSMSTTSASGTAGPLLGDSMVNAIQNSLASIVDGGVKSGSTSASLASIGISLGSNGQLSVNSTELTDALQNSPSTVATLFNSTNGIGKQLNTSITSYTQTGGILDSRTAAINTDLTNISTQQTALTNYAAQLSSQYNDQFTALNTLMAQMNSNAQYLTQLFGGTNSAGALATASSSS